MYYLDSHKEIKIYKLVLHDTYSTLLLSKLDRVYCLDECIRLVDDVIDGVESSTTVGFLSSPDLRRFPVIAELLQPFLQPVSESEILSYVCGEKSMETYKWIYNLLILMLYLICLETLNSTDLTLEASDKIDDLRQKEDGLYTRLDPSIRQYIQKRGLSIKQNTYIGFDTEFKVESLDFNRLLSAQLAVTTKTIIQIPRVKGYKLSKLNETTNKLQPLNTTSTVLNYKKLESSIKMCIDEIRYIKYAKHDVIMYQLTEGMKMVKGIEYSEVDEHTVFSLPRSIVQPYIHFGNTFSFREIIQISSDIAKPHHDKMNKITMDVIEKISQGYLSERQIAYDGVEKLVVGIEQTLPTIETSEVANISNISNISNNTLFSESDVTFGVDSEKRLSREYITELFPQKISVTRTRQYYLIAHLTPADLSLLSDFNIIKEELSIVNGSFVTIGKPLKYLGRNIHIRDTMLLAPGSSKSLASIGKLYGGVLEKISIRKEDLEDMSGFLARDKVKFTDYALRDAVISLIHACWMEDFNFKMGYTGVPLSLSSIGRNYVKSVWKDELYGGYQISSKYLLGDSSTTITPKGLNVIKQLGFVLPYYTANYRGGRNECFMFGLDRDTVWYDYDLTSAYTTVLSVAGHPDYERCTRMSISELKRMSKSEILYSYLIIHADFEFPIETKYPSIPSYIDENCTVYPLKGNCVITGAEYLLALSQNCMFKIFDIYNTPFKDSEYKDIKPFSTIVNLVQEQRREHAKGTISNQMYKEIGNSIYGSVVRGIGNKRKFDIKSQGTVRMHGDELTNPLIASWTTAFVRSVMGECLHSIPALQGTVVSVTTDGFITNISDLEEKISKNFLFAEYKKIRQSLAGDDTGLELKSKGVGIIVWTTRGQLGIESKIIATTGIQHRLFQGKSDMLKTFIATMKTGRRTLEFVQSRLRSATDIYKQGGHVTMVRRDQLFRMHYDNRRVLDWETTIPASIEVLVDSKPLLDVEEGRNLRSVARLTKQPQYGKYIGGAKKLRSYKSKEELVIRNFLKCLLTQPPLFNLTRVELNTYPLVLEYIKTYDPRIKLTTNSLALITTHIKTSKVKWMPVEKTVESDKFVEYVLQKFEKFDVDGFYGVGS